MSIYLTWENKDQHTFYIIKLYFIDPQKQIYKQEFWGRLEISEILLILNQFKDILNNFVNNSNDDFNNNVDLCI